ncbi:MAG: adenosylcobinamide-GDP ribazoletransferase [Symbiobacteriia bacterium]
MRLLAVALVFLTRLPIRLRGEVTEAEVSRSAAWFPLAGVLIGLLLAGLDLVFRHLLPDPVTAVLDAIVLILITGGLHLDGLMDTADGVGSGRPAAGALEIMRDSRVGAMGAMAGTAALLLRVALYMSLAGSLRWRALVLAPALGRAAVVWAAARYPSARPGLGSRFADGLGRRELAAAVGGALLVALLVAGTAVSPQAAFTGVAAAGVSPAGLVPLLAPLSVPVHVGAALILAALTAVGTAAWLGRRLGGHTGDTYGALCELTELAALGAFTLHWGVWR